MNKENILRLNTLILYLLFLMSCLLFGCSFQESYIEENCMELLFLKKEYDKSFECAEQGLKKYPNNSLLYYIRANYYYHQNKMHFAINDMEQTIKYYDLLDDNYKKYLKIEDLYNDLGKLYDSVKNYDKALECFNKALDIEPLYITAMKNIALTYIKLDNPISAINYLNKAIQIKKDDEIAYFFLGISYYKLGNLDTALIFINKSINLLPDRYYDVYNLRGEIYYKLGENAKALADFEKAMELYINSNDYDEQSELYSELKSKIELIKNNLK
ncbi:MAG: tetratricopeptide repeat protein [Ignavibacteria bacterium]|nr:tetratricopeptide repeat protein [Ignavibacteria bacterium]